MLGDIIVVLIVGALLLVCVCYMGKRKKNGESSCGGCSSCSGGCAGCSFKDEEQE